MGQSEALRVRLTLEQARCVRAEVDAGRVVYQGALPSTDVVFAAAAGYVEQLFVLHDPSAPSELAWRMELGEALVSVRRSSEGGLLLVDRRGNARLRIAPPYAVEPGACGVPLSCGTRRGAWWCGSMRAGSRTRCCWTR